MQVIKKIQGFILFIVAIVLGVILLPISFCVGLILANANDYLFRLAYSIDQLGNVVCGPLFDIVLVKDSSVYKFGNPDDTISYVMALNKSESNLTRTGKVLDWILNFIDPGHTDLKRQASDYEKAVK
jgi:hypothetical protein